MNEQYVELLISVNKKQVPNEFSHALRKLAHNPRSKELQDNANKQMEKFLASRR